MVFNLTITGIDPAVRPAPVPFAPGRLVPVPRVVKLDGEVPGFFSLTDRLRVNENLPEKAKQLVDLLATELAATCHERSIRVEHVTGTFPVVSISPDFTKHVPAGEQALFDTQGYVLDACGEYITIAADTPRGIFHGIATLLQLLDGRGTFPRVRIGDWPSMEIRGVSDENARGQAATVEGLKAYCRMLGLLKLNVLQVNLEDMFRSERHPKSTDDARGCYSRAEMRAVSEFAARYFVEVTPVQSTCGHLDNLFVLPEYKHLAEYEHVAMCYDISNPAIYPFINDIVEEEVDAWHLSRSFHMACDESWDVGKGRSKSFVDARGIGQAYLNHYTRCYEIIKAALEAKHGKGNARIYLYHDIMIHHEAVLKGLPRENLVIDVWVYSPKETYKEVDTILDHGFDFIVSPSVMDYQRVLPSYAASEKNIINLITYAHEAARAKGKPGAFKGQVNTTWGDFRSENLRDVRIHGYALSATVSWNVEPWRGFTNKQHATWPALREFKHGFYRLVLGIQDEAAAGALDAFLHDITTGKVFPSWFGPNMIQPKLWTHPLHPLRGEWGAGRYPRAIEAIDAALATCASCMVQARGGIPRATAYLDAVAASLRVYRLFCMKQALGPALRRARPDRMAASARQALAARAAAMTKTVIETRDAYKASWDLHCKPAGSYDFLLGQYDTMARFYTEIAADLDAGYGFPDPFVPAEYIYIDTRLAFDTPVTLRQAFIIDDVPAGAWVQAFAINHATIRLNGKTVGDVEFRTTLSQVILEHCVKTWDVAPVLVPGENVIEVALVNNTRTWPVLNLLLELRGKSGEVRRIVSDDTWTWAADGQSWSRVRSMGPPPSVLGGLTRPRLDAGERSHFTRWLGIANEATAFVKLDWLVRFLIALVKRARITM